MFLLFLRYLLLSSQVHGWPDLRARLTERDLNLTAVSNGTVPFRQLTQAGSGGFLPATDFSNAVSFNGAGYTVTNEFINNTESGTYSLIILYGVAVINITVEACLLQPTKQTIGQWTTLDGQVDDTASMSDIIGDAYSGRNQYGNSYSAMLQSTANNCQDTLNIMDSMFQDIVCNDSAPVAQQGGLLSSTSQAIQNLPVHNELRHLLANEAAPTSVLRSNLKYFGFLTLASAASGVIVGTVTNKVYPNNTNIQTFCSGLFPASVVLLSGLLTWISTRELRNDVRVLVAAAAASKLKDNTVRVVKVVRNQASGAIKKRKIGKTPSGAAIVEMGGAAMGGGTFCVDSNSFEESYPYISQLSSTDLAMESLNDAADSALRAAEEGSCGAGPSGL